MSLANSKVFEQFRESLLHKRQTLLELLSTTPATEKQMRLGPADERAVQEHLHVVDAALEKATNETLGVCTVCHEYVGTELLEMDYTTCVCIDHLSPEEIRRLEAELELSQVVQRSLLPEQAPDIPGLELAAFSRPAEIISGDFFDFFRFGDGRHGIAIADVAGKGVSASLLMASVQTALRTLAPQSDSPADVLSQLNRLFRHNINFTTFVTLFLGCFDLANHTLTYGNAGHNPPVIFQAGGNGREQMRWLQPTGAAIGLIEDFPFSFESATLSPGDMLLLYTDGVTEAINPQNEQFGEERLAGVVQQASSSSASELVRALRQALQEFSVGQPLADDTTIIACRIVG
jgi:sigma-B regulation protein RsbU (phosphoserine phosphatase)